jgi:hypothetical protein
LNSKFNKQEIEFVEGKGSGWVCIKISEDASENIFLWGAVSHGAKLQAKRCCQMLELVLENLRIIILGDRPDWFNVLNEFFIDGVSHWDVSIVPVELFLGDAAIIIGIHALEDLRDDLVSGLLANLRRGIIALKEFRSLNFVFLCDRIKSLSRDFLAAIIKWLSQAFNKLGERNATVTILVVELDECLSLNDFREETKVVG